ncbi:MAG: sensor domain-containing diguanylate cyclase [Xanthomonadales bacterium]|nr:sensor domain-containing diguanylate cyclase [Xanthomonadales bacterium]
MLAMTAQRRLALYCLLLPLLAAPTVWLVADHYLRWPLAGQVVFGVASLLFVWHFGIPGVVGGVRSMERVPQVAMLLIGGPVPAIVQNVIAALIFPFTHAGYRQNSWRIAVLRALSNAAMLTLMLVAGALVYRALGGEYPLPPLKLSHLLPLTGMALAMQAVNLLMLIAYHAAAGRPVAKSPRDLMNVTDLLFVPVGVLAALVWLHLGAVALLLFSLFVVLFLVSFRSGHSPDPLVAGSLADDSHLSGAQRLDQLATQINDEVQRTFVLDEFMFGILDRAQHHLEVRLHLMQGQRMPRVVRRREEGLFGWVVENDEALLVADFEHAPEDVRRRTKIVGPPPGSMLIVPMHYENEVIGIISVQHLLPNQYRRDDLTLLQDVADRLARRVADARAFEELDDYRADLEKRVNERTAELRELVEERETLLRELQEKNSQLDRLSREDPLTGLANRREFDHALGRELATAGRHGRALCLALVDLDHFKRINDRFGHSSGDQVLVRTARLFTEHFRAGDLVARIGGEEFGLLLPDCDLADAVQRCERLRQAFADADWRDVHPELQPTLSVGVSRWQGEPASRLLARADAALYAAKRAGRNRTNAEESSLLDASTPPPE